VKVGHYVHWRVVNDSHEIHAFHIHQAHFLVYEENGKKVARPEWLDTVNVAAEGSVDLIMDFTDPIIRGMSVFHCHLLKHEDKGMMAKILFQCLARSTGVETSPWNTKLWNPSHHNAALFEDDQPGGNEWKPPVSGRSAEKEMLENSR
jgi:hypothetical protein